MADHPELADRVRRLLEDEVDVVEQRMVGSVGTPVGGVLRAQVGRCPRHVMAVRVPLAAA